MLDIVTLIWHKVDKLETCGYGASVLSKGAGLPKKGVPGFRVRPQAFMRIVVRTVTFALFAACAALVILSAMGNAPRALFAVVITLFVLRLMLLPFQAAGVVIREARGKAESGDTE